MDRESDHFNEVSSMKETHYNEMQAKIKELETTNMKHTMAASLKDRVYKD